MSMLDNARCSAEVAEELGEQLRENALAKVGKMKERKAIIRSRHISYVVNILAKTLWGYNDVIISCFSSDSQQWKLILKLRLKEEQRMHTHV